MRRVFTILRSTHDGKAHLAAVEVPDDSSSFSSSPSFSPRERDGDEDEENEKEGARRFKVSTRRGKQFNTLIYAETDPLTGADRDAIFMSGDDAGALHLQHGDRIALVNDLGRYEGRVFIADIAPGNLQVMWPEGNVIIRRGVVDAGGGVPDYNASVRVVTLRPVLP